MKIISWNINGIIGTFTEGHLDEVINQNPDILCIQEIKTSVIPIIRGYKAYAYPSLFGGNYGTAIYTKIEPLSVEKGFGDEEFDEEGRVIRMEFENFCLFNLYDPTGASSKENYSRKCRFYEEFTEYINKSDVCIEKCKNYVNKDTNLAMFYNNASIGFKQKALNLSLEDADKIIV